MNKREILAGHGYGDDKKGKRLVLSVSDARVRYRMIAVNRASDIRRIGGEYEISRDQFAAWAVRPIHDPHGLLHDEDVQRSLDDDTRQRTRKGHRRPLQCGRCGETRPVEAYRPGQRGEKPPLCAQCEDAAADEAYEWFQASQRMDQPPVRKSVSRKTQSKGTPVSRYANVGHSRSRAKITAARENGRKGGRPPKWSSTVRRVAAELLRTAARSQRDGPTAEEMVRMAKALEDGTMR
jgi:hypothetical protein